MQIGRLNWGEQLQGGSKNELDWHFLDVEIMTEESCKDLVGQMKRRAFDVVLCTDILALSFLEVLAPLIESYALILDYTFENEVSEWIRQVKQPIFMSLEDKNKIVETICQYFFSGQMGSKLHVHRIAVSESFEGETMLLGEHRLNLKGNFSELGTPSPTLTWQYNMGMYGRSKKIWLEFKSSSDTKITFKIFGIREGGSQILKTWTFNEEEMKKGIEIPYQEGLGYLSLSLTVEGKGEVEIGPLHYRDSRDQYGEYILGGKKITDTQNEELFYYFHPGDLKPPLTVYFSGYRSAEGFEGFYMMKKLGAPFLLITDPRLEGGSFYLGSPELETSLVNVIQAHLKKLNFTHQELILSGLSMGTFGALYYGSFLHPHTIIVGKPLVNLGSMAEKERILRPGGFPTSLDLLQSLTGRQDKKGIKALDQRFWSAFDKAKFEETQFVIAYMQDDDYDDKAYGQILEHLVETKSHVIGKGIAGRHNDNSPAINQWFINHYRRILDENFNRGGKYEFRNQVGQANQ